MINITLREYFKKYGPNKLESVINTLELNNITPNIRFGKFIDYFGNEITIQIPTFDETMELLDKVNKEIKHPNVSKNVRNKFYKFKHHILKDLIKYFNKITEIGDCGNYYSLHYNEYIFHQLKNSFRNPLTCTHVEEYTPQTYNIPFNKNDYNLCLIGITTYCYNKITKYE